MGLPRLVTKNPVLSSNLLMGCTTQHFRTHSVMQTFMKMAGAVYTMAGLGTIEESKLFKEKFECAMGDRDLVDILPGFSSV